MDRSLLLPTSATGRDDETKLVHLPHVIRSLKTREVVAVGRAFPRGSCLPHRNSVFVSDRLQTAAYPTTEGEFGTWLAFGLPEWEMIGTCLSYQNIFMSITPYVPGTGGPVVRCLVFDSLTEPNLKLREEIFPVGSNDEILQPDGSWELRKPA